MRIDWKKTVTAGLASLFLGLSLTGCAGDDGIPDSGRTVKIAATNFALYDFARLYESEGIEAQMLIAPGSESHDMEATLSDMSVISEADIFIYAGGESDLWVDAVFASLGEAGEDIIRINALEFIEGEAHTREEGGHDHDHTADEHTWTSIPNAMALIGEIGNAIRRVDETKDLTDINPEIGAYLAELGALDQEYRDMVKNAVRTEIAVADRFPFTHMAEEYGLSWSAAFDGCTSNVEVPLSVISGMITEVETKKLPVVFHIEFSDMTAVNAVCEQTGAEPLLLHSCHNVTKAELDAGITYLELMRRNLENLKKALY